MMNALQHKHFGSAGLAVALALVSGISMAAPGSADGMARFDTGAISGLGARNIGSAAMSGRIAALAAAPAKDGKLLI